MIRKIIDYLNKLNPLNIFILILILGLVYGGVSLYSKYLGFSKVMNKTKITTVKAIPVTIGTAQKTYRALSTIESFESIEITSNVNGIIDDIFFNEGSIVKLGDKLFSNLSSMSLMQFNKLKKDYSGLGYSTVGIEVYEN